MKMPRAMSIFAVSIILFAAASGAHAEMLLENFDDGWSPGLWEIDKNHDLWTVAAPDPSGRLQVSKPADDDQSTASEHISGGLHSLFTLDGDFAVSVDYQLLAFPDAGLGYNEAVMRVKAEDTGASFWCLIYMIEDRQNAEGYDSWNDMPVGPIPDSSTEGVFEIQREGQTLSALIDRGSGLELLGSASDSAFLGPVSLDIFAAQIVRPTGYRSFSEMDVRFDNFSVTAETIIPEPATLSLLVLGGVGLLRRRSRFGS